MSALLISFFMGCRSAYIEDDALRQFNAELARDTYRARQDIHPNFFSVSEKKAAPPLFKKGQQVGLWVESSMNWVRVKGFDIHENREQAFGDTVIYLFENELKSADEEASTEESTDSGDSVEKDREKSVDEPETVTDKDGSEQEEADPLDEEDLRVINLIRKKINEFFIRKEGGSPISWNTLDLQSVWNGGR